MKSEQRQEASENDLGQHPFDKKGRPAVPAEMARRVLFEAGHRCSVCGAEIPLERAHIIPWSSCHEHSSENLICLCANCHARADLERWGVEVLHAYKARPWVLRQRESQDLPIEEKASIRLTINMELEDFDERYQRFLRYAVASFLDIPPEAVTVTKVEEGSVRVTLDVPRVSIGFLSEDSSSLAAIMNIAQSFNARRMEILDESGKSLISAFESEEKKLAEIWERILGKSEVNILDDFFELGGYALRAQLCAGIHREFGVEIPIGDLSRFPTVKLQMEKIRIIRAETELAKSREVSNRDKHSRIGSAEGDHSSSIDWRQSEGAGKGHGDLIERTGALEVVNDTTSDAQFRVVTLGSLDGHFVPSEETSRWPVIAAGCVVSLTLTSKGPWRVIFFVNGECLSVDARSTNDQIHLLQGDGNSFRTMVRKVSRATHRSADHAKSA